MQKNQEATESISEKSKEMANSVITSKSGDPPKVSDNTAPSQPSSVAREPTLKTKGKAHGQTGPKSQAGKNRSRWNALKDGATAKSSVLPFESEALYKKHIKDVEKALAPTNYVEINLVRDYAEGIWRIIRHEKRGSYEREAIFSKLTAPMVASMLNLEDRYIGCAPQYLLDLKYKISKNETTMAKMALTQYHHLMVNAKNIANFNLVWRQYRELFEALSDWLIARNPSSTPIMLSSGNGLNLPWQQSPKELVKILERFSDHLFYVANFEELKPKIRVCMESWYFLQRSEIRKVEFGEQILAKERNYVNSILDRLARLRKCNIFSTSFAGNA